MDLDWQRLQIQGSQIKMMQIENLIVGKTGRQNSTSKLNLVGC